MEIIDLLRKLLPSEIVDNFVIVRFEKTFDEKKIQEEEDAVNENIIAYGVGDYKIIQDFPLRGRFTHLHLRKRKWLDKSTGEIFSYSIDTSEYEGTRLNAEFGDFLKEEC
ncbi:transposase family protein [Bacteroides caecimuris]|uniref:ISAon1 family transposase N-terminal region protein n=1 Tax=Bacteroides caecimuris TaxID=1796613 RepID=UPI002657B4AE|nr:transposase family protein [Bacteroides caecimuris]